MPNPLLTVLAKRGAEQTEQGIRIPVDSCANADRILGKLVAIQGGTLHHSEDGKHVLIRGELAARISQDEQGRQILERGMTPGTENG